MQKNPIRDIPPAFSHGAHVSQWVFKPSEQIFAQSIWHPWQKFAHFKTWPLCEDFNSLADAQLSRLGLKFEVQPPLTLRAKRKSRALNQKSGTSFLRTYLHKIANEGAIPTREKNWHDFFNALVWNSFPKSKLAITRLCLDNLSTNSPNQRTRLGDFLSQVDEGGLIFLVDENNLEECQNRLKSLGLTEKSQILDELQRLAPFVFGHGIFDCWVQSLPPSVVKFFLWPVSKKFFEKELTDQLSATDELFCDKIQNVSLEHSGLFPISALMRSRL